MKRLTTYWIIVLLFMTPSYNSTAQDDFIIQKELNINNNVELKHAINKFIHHLVEETNGQIIFNCDHNNTAIIKGQLQLKLSDSPFEIDWLFNGSIEYQLTINYDDKKLYLTFDKLTHHSNESINGYDFDYGTLKKNNKSEKKAIFANYDFIHEDHHRLARFSADESMSTKIHIQTLYSIEQLITEASK